MRDRGRVKFPERKPKESQRTKTERRRKKWNDKKKQFLWMIILDMEEKKNDKS